jgi:hypothetical protein
MSIHSRFGTALIVLFCVGCGSASDISERIAGHRASPFSLFGRNDMRSGLRFDVFRDAARKESVKQYECTNLWAKAQRCSLAIESGMLSAVVDSTGHVIRLVASTDPILRNGINVHGQLIFRDVVRDTRLAWDSVGTMRVDDSDPTAPQFRWLDRSQRWGASLWYSRLRRADVPRSSGMAIEAELAMTLPESIGVTDMPSYALFMQLRPLPPTPEPIPPKHTAPPRPPTVDELISMMRSDLRALTIAEEVAVHRTGRYESEMSHLPPAKSDGVRLELVDTTAEGFSAIASHPSLPGLTCVVFAGDVSSPPATQREGRRAVAGEIVCDRP